MNFSDEELEQAQEICDAVSDAVERLAVLQDEGETPDESPDIWREVKRALEGVRVKAATNDPLNHLFEDGVAEDVETFVEQADGIENVEAALEDEETDDS